MIRYLFLCFVFLVVLPLGGAYAYDLPEKPETNVHIVDQAKIIDATTELQVQRLAAQLKRDRGISMVVVTIEELPKKRRRSSRGLRTMTIEEYGNVLFNTWGIGYRAHNYGILLVVAVKDKKARIQFGSDWRHEYDDEAQNVMDTILVPAFKREHYAEGVLDGVNALDYLARNVLQFEINKQKVGAITAIFALGILALIIPLFSNISAPRNMYDWIFSAGTSVSFIALYGAYSFGLVTHLEWLNTLSLFVLIITVYLSVYLFVYAGRHSAKDTFFRASKLVLMCLFVPVFVVGALYFSNAKRSIFGDGTADGGGGATGQW
jgi:uncharacterized membrane protein YgcG